MDLINLNNTNFILASGSPRRIEILNNHGLYPKVLPSGADESLPGRFEPHESAMFLAMEKALWTINNHKLKEKSIVVSADTIVVFKDEILGKPTDETSAYNMLKALSKGIHAVYTGICIHTVTDGFLCCYGESIVRFDDLSDSFLREYIKTSEPYDKAGGYAIQGTFEKYSTLLAGEIDNVIGFPFKVFKENLLKL